MPRCRNVPRRGRHRELTAFGDPATLDDRARRQRPARQEPQRLSSKIARRWAARNDG